MFKMSSNAINKKWPMSFSHFRHILLLIIHAAHIWTFVKYRWRVMSLRLFNFSLIYRLQCIKSETRDNIFIPVSQSPRWGLLKFHKWEKIEHLVKSIYTQHPLTFWPCFYAFLLCHVRQLCWEKACCLCWLLPAIDIDVGYNTLNISHGHSST